MNVAVCIPYRPMAGEWVANLQAVRLRYEGLGWPIFLGDHPGELFSRAWAINAAAAAAIRDVDPDVLFITDADLFFPRADPLRAAVTQAYNENCYVVAYTDMLVLGPEGSEKARAGLPESGWQVIEGISRIWGGAFAISRLLWDRIGGFDERFIGYGHEDLGFLPAANTLGSRPKQRVSGLVYHLSHPRNDQDRSHFVENAQLASRYRSCDGDVDGIYAILAER